MECGLATGFIQTPPQVRTRPTPSERTTHARTVSPAMYETFSVRTAMLHLVLSAFPISVLLLVLAACCLLLFAASLGTAPKRWPGWIDYSDAAAEVSDAAGQVSQFAASQNGCVDAPPSCCRTPPQSEPEHTPPLKIPSL